MRKHTAVFGVLLAALLILSFVAGCSRKQETGASSGGQTPAELRAAAQSASMISELTRKQQSVQSYIKITGAGEEKMIQAVKYQYGQPLRIKTTTGADFVLVEYDKSVIYSYDSKAKAASVVPVASSGTEGIGSSTKMPVTPDASASSELQSAKVKSGKLGAMDCWVVEQTGGNGKLLWFDKQYGLLRQTKMGDEVGKITYEKINAVPDSEFELPPGTKTQGMSGTPAASAPGEVSLPAGQ